MPVAATHSRTHRHPSMASRCPVASDHNRRITVIPAGHPGRHRRSPGPPPPPPAAEFHRPGPFPSPHHLRPSNESNMRCGRPQMALAGQLGSHPPTSPIFPPSFPPSIPLDSPLRRPMRMETGARESIRRHAWIRRQNMQMRRTRISLQFGAAHRCR